MATPFVRGNSLYTIVDGPSWTQAEANSVKLGGHLAAISSADENSILFSLVGPSKRLTDQKWIGLNDAKVEGNWEWSNGEPVTYTNWSYVAPAQNSSIYYGPGLGAESQDYVMFWWGTNDGTWDDFYVTGYEDADGRITQGIAEIPLVQRGDSVYVIVQGPTWEEAEANAIKLGGHLVTVNDSAESGWLGEEFSKAKYQYAEDNVPWAPSEDSINHFWTGGKKVNGQWQWASGETFNTNLSSLYLNNSYDPESNKLLGIFNNPNHGSNIYLDDSRDAYPVNPGLPYKGIAEIKLNSQITPIYSLSTSASALNEGSTLTTTVKTSNVNAGTTLYYSLSGAGITASDFSSGALLGWGVVNDSGTFSFSHTIANDLTTEGTETLNIKLFSDSNLASQVGSTASLTINDTSTTPVSTINVQGNNSGIANTGTINNNGSINTGTQVTNITNITNNTTNNISNTNVNNNYVYYNTNNTTYNSWNTYYVDNSVKAQDVVAQWFPSSQPIAQSQDLTDTKYLDVAASTWRDKVKLKTVAQAANTGSNLESSQINFDDPSAQGSVLNGSTGKDQIYGKAGWDILDGGAGNDLIHGGNGRDIITGGLGSDELHGDFGWNTYKSEKDGSSDLIAIKSDQWLVNWMYGKAGNNPNGEKADIIEGLDSSDQIRIIGVSTSDLTFQANATAHGVSGIGIYAKGALEAVYTGGDLSLGQIQAMTSGDASYAAMNNNISSYGWTQHPGTFVAS